MNLRTSQEAALVDCCGCPRPQCDPPRIICESVSAALASVGFFKSEDTSWQIYLAHNELLTISQSLDIPGETYSSSADDAHNYTYSRNFEGGIGTSSECTAWTADLTEDCSSHGTATRRIYNTHIGPGDIEVRDELVNDTVTTRSDVTGTPCAYLDTEVGHDYTTDPTTTATSSSGNNLITTIYSLPGGGDTYTNTFTGGTTYADWVSETRATVLDDLIFPNDGCLDATPACSSKLIVTPDPGATGSTLFMTVIQTRFQVGIPEAWADFSGRHATWATAHTAWLAADPETRGAEPIEPIERTIYETQWDLGFFPKEWDTWKALHDARLAAQTAHEHWETCIAGDDSDSCGSEPIIPADPGTEPTPKPSLVAHQSWTYDGSEEFSDNFLVPVPETAGETRRVNMMTICYHSTRLGVLPTAHGEVHVFEDE